MYEFEEKSLRDLAIERIKVRRAEQDGADRLAHRHQRWHYVIGLPGALFGTTGAVSFAIEQVPALASWIALVGGALSSVGAFLGSKGLAALHFRRHDCLAALADRMENAIADGRDLTRDELDKFAVEWRECTGGGKVARRHEREAAGETAASNS
jgi:hypothetical protein